MQRQRLKHTRDDLVAVYDTTNSIPGDYVAGAVEVGIGPPELHSIHTLSARARELAREKEPGEKKVPFSY